MVNYISVPVPEEHVPRVYALLAQLDAEASGALAPVAGPPELVFPQPEIPVLDEALVTRMYNESESRHRRLMEFLADHPDQWFFTGELAEALEVKTGRKGMAGVFGAFGRRSKHRYGGAIPWELSWEPEKKEEVQYLMKPEVATWVRAAAAS